MSKYNELSATLLTAFANRTPIEGGVRYEDALRKIALDGSLDSLKQIDRLLSAIRRDMTARGQGESELKQADFRNFVLIVAFYAGKAAGQGVDWLSAGELQAYYPAVNAKSFFQMMAMNGMTKPLFILQNIAARLFGSLDKPFVSPVDNLPATDSVYWAVKRWLDDAQANPNKPNVTAPTTNPIQPTTAQSANAQTTNTNPSITQTSVAQAPTAQAATKTTATQTTNTTKTQPPKKPAKKDSNDKLLEEIKSDLITLPAVNDTQDMDYKNAVNTLDKVEQYIKAQMLEKDLPYHEIALDGKVKVAQANAIKHIMQIAKAGNTNAMIRLALCFFEGVGVTKNDEKGAGLIKTAAEKGDTRAQKLLSKLYYQGIGVTQNMPMGELWLDKAAAGGHPEAKKIKSYMNQVQLMKDDYRVQSEKDKRFMLWLGAAGVFIIAVIWVSAKFL